MKPSTIEQFKKVRKQTEDLCANLNVEDYGIQGMEDVSPPKWHLAHTSWFFETFILRKNKNYAAFDDSFHRIFNSYYQGLGCPYPRDKRGLLSRPSTEMVYEYRAHVDKHLLQTIDKAGLSERKGLEALIIFGLEHEHQHQELLLMDIKYNFFLQPELPRYQKSNKKQASDPIPLAFSKLGQGIKNIGHEEQSFCFDNELPLHPVIVHDCSIANRLITNQEYLAFIEDGGYRNPLLWLSDGWDWVCQNQSHHPLYWKKPHEEWMQFTLDGMQLLHPHEPVCHVNFYEAEAFARWYGARLPFEEEWEAFVKELGPSQGNAMENGLFHPLPAEGHSPQQFFGDVWEWTLSSYAPYPGFKPTDGKLAEYNEKFMNNERVMRGGCCATPRSQLRASYRNYFQPDKRWQFSGIRLAKN